MVRIRLLLGFGLLLCMMVPVLALGASRPEVGTMAPEFTLPSQEGKPVSLKDFRGKWVVLYFYPKDFTSGCTIEAHNFQRDESKYVSKNAVIIGVSLDSVDSHKNFCVEEGLSFKLLSDSSHQVSREYGTLTNLGVTKYASRNTFLINPEGKIVKVYDDVNPRNHSEEVLTDLTKLESMAAK